MATLLRSLPLRRVAHSAPAFLRPSALRHFSSYPTDRKYTSSHEWAKLDGDVATIGITDHAQAALGDIVFADMPEIGSSAVSGERAATIESVKAAADIYAPLDGEVVGVNEQLEDSPDLINQEPHEDGWMFRIKVPDTSQLDKLMGSDDYEKLLETEK